MLMECFLYLLLVSAVRLLHSKTFSKVSNFFAKPLYYVIRAYIVQGHSCVHRAGF